MGVGRLKCVVINVTDLPLANKFWAAVTGLEVIGSETGWHEWLGYLGTKDPWKPEIILQRVDNSPLDIQAPNPGRPNQMHIDGDRGDHRTWWQRQKAARLAPQTGIIWRLSTTHRLGSHARPIRQ